MIPKKMHSVLALLHKRMTHLECGLGIAPPPPDTDLRYSYDINQLKRLYIDFASDNKYLFDYSQECTWYITNKDEKRIEIAISRLEPIDVQYTTFQVYYNNLLYVSTIKQYNGMCDAETMKTFLNMSFEDVLKQNKLKDIREVIEEQYAFLNDWAKKNGYKCKNNNTVLYLINYYPGGHSKHFCKNVHFHLCDKKPYVINVTCNYKTSSSPLQWFQKNYDQTTDIKPSFNEHFMDEVKKYLDRPWESFE